MTENKLLTNKHGLLCLQRNSEEYKNLQFSFCRKILNSTDEISELNKHGILFLGGDIKQLLQHKLLTLPIIFLNKKSILIMF